MTPVADTPVPPGGVSRRGLLLAPLVGCVPGASAQTPAAAERRWVEAAEQMRQLALSWGDQPYGAVLVKDGRIIGHGPSRVVQRRDPQAHAEREAIRDALARAGAAAVAGSDLVSTSPPCAACETAAAAAGIRRLFAGPEGLDAGAPRPRG
jgi:tRNA(adenine34) deaminase